MEAHMYNYDVLDNGLRVVSERLEHVGSVSVGFWIGAAPVTENTDNNGISHFIEHMLFKGTVSRTAKEIVDCIDGAGGHINAYTSSEFTCYYTKTLESELETALSVLCDMIQNPLFAGKDIDVEKTVVAEEISMYEDSPDELAQDNLFESAWGGTNLGMPILGSQKTIKTFTPEVLRTYLQEYYFPSNMVVSVSGNFDREHLLDILRKNTAGLADKQYAAPDERKVFNKGYFSKKKNIKQNHLCIGFEAFERDSEYQYPLLVVNSILGDGMGSRLFQKIREERGLAYSIGSGITTLKNTGMFSVSTGFAPKNAEAVLNMIFDEIKSLINREISDDEISRAKAQLAGNYILGLESTSSRMSMMGKSLLLTGKIKTEDEILALIKNVGHDSIYAVCDIVFNTDNVCLSEVGAKVGKKIYSN